MDQSILNRQSLSIGDTRQQVHFRFRPGPRMYQWAEIVLLGPRLADMRSLVRLIDCSGGDGRDGPFSRLDPFSTPQLPSSQWCRQSPRECGSTALFLVRRLRMSKCRPEGRTAKTLGHQERFARR